MTVETPDISEYLDFGFYGHLSYKDNDRLEMMAIRRWFGVSHRICGIMSYCILTKKVTVISRTTVQCLTILEKDIDKVKVSVSEFDTGISRHFK